MSASPDQPILLLHGQPGNAHDWDRVKGAIGERARVLAIDRPGWGRGSAPADIAGNAAAALAELGARGAQTATVVGFSLGAAVAAWLAADHPERVTRLVLIAPAANRASMAPLDYLLAKPVAGELLTIPAMAAVGVALLTRPLRRRLASLLSIEDRYLASAGRGLLSPSTWRANAAEQRALVRDMDALESRLGKITASTTIIAGTADRITPIASARALAGEIPGSRLVEIHGAGHLMLHGHAERLADIIVGL